VTNIKLAFLPSFQADYFTEEAKGAAAEAKKLGITINVQNPAGSAAAALTDLQTLVGTGTQGVLYVSPDSPSGASGFAIAKKANIPLIAADNNIDGAPFVGFQWASIATQVAKLDSQYLAAENWNPADTTAVSIELQTLDTCNQRTNAETATFKSASPTFAKSVVHVPYDGSINGSLTALGPVKTAHPSTKHWVLWSCNDEGVVGAIQALTAAGVNPSDIIGVGLGGGQACPLWNAGKTQSMRAVLYADPAKSGALGIQELYDFLANKTPIPASVALGATIVTPANYKTAMAGYVNC
jgi:L-arabinose transport system substrate-binding protein